MNTIRIKTVLSFALAAMVLLVVSAPTANAATVTVSQTAPTVDGSDMANLAPETGSLKWFDDVEHDAGQTFTPADNGQLNSFTFKIGTGKKNDFDAADEWLNFRLGTITRPGGVFTFTDIYSEEAHWTMDWASDDYVTITLDTPQELTGGVEYGIIIDAQEMGNWTNGIPYLAENDNSNYPDGHAIGRGTTRNKDLVFHVDMAASGVDPELPTVEAGSDWVTWSNKPVQLDDSSVINNSASNLIINWTAVSSDPNGTIIEFSATDVASPEITITKAAGNPITVTCTLAANYEGSTSDDVVDTMVIDVYDTSCLAAEAFGTVTLDPTDINRDCVTDMLDLYELAAKWLTSYQLDAPASK